MLAPERRSLSAQQAAKPLEARASPAKLDSLSDESAMTQMIRVALPFHLRTLAKVDGEVTLDIEGVVTQRSVLDALEARHPVLCGTMRDHVTLKRRPFIRFFACEEDLSHEPPDAPLPDAVATGAEPFLVVGAIAGG